MCGGNATIKYMLIFFLAMKEVTVTSSLLYIVRQTCSRGAVFTPVPSTVNNICLQCICVMTNISYCKTLIVQLSVVCSAALVTNPVVAVTTAPAATTTATTRAPTATVPTIPASVATATTAIGINPRASSPAAPAAMMNGPPTTLVMSGSPMMMMIMAASNAAAGVTMSTATIAPAPAG